MSGAAISSLLDAAALPGEFTFQPTEEVLHAPGCIARLGGVLERLGIERGLLVTGNTLATQTDLVDRVRGAAGGRIAAVFHETVQHVHRNSVLRAAEAARAIEADGIVTFGGGTTSDTGKAVVLALAEGIASHADFDSWRVRFQYPSDIEVPAMTCEGIPLVAVPTTLSAAEYTHIAGITDDVRHVKDLYIAKPLAPRVVFLDPELTLATPLWLWLSTGIRAVDHSIETLSSTTAHPFTDALSVRSLELLNRYLRECKAHPDDLDARCRAQVAAWMSFFGVANVTLGLSHGVGHQLGARNDVPHGYTSCVMMCPTMVFNKDHVGGRQAVVAQAMGIDISGLDVDAAGEAARDAVLLLIKELELPHRLRDVGVGPQDFEAIASDALEDMVVATNPRPVKGAGEVVELLESAY